MPRALNDAAHGALVLWLAGLVREDLWDEIETDLLWKTLDGKTVEAAKHFPRIWRKARSNVENKLMYRLWRQLSIELAPQLRDGLREAEREDLGTELGEEGIGI